MKWEIVKAEQFCYSVVDGTHDSPKALETGRYLITSKHLKNNQIDFSSAKKISEEDYKKIIIRSSVQQWDILYSMIGTIGNLYLETNASVEYACKNVGIFKFNNNKENALWLYYFLQSPLAISHIQSHLRGSTQQYIPLGELRELPVIVPPRDIRNKIVKVLRSIDEKVINNQKINRNLAATSPLTVRAAARPCDNRSRRSLFGDKDVAIQRRTYELRNEDTVCLAC